MGGMRTRFTIRLAQEWLRQFQGVIANRYNMPIGPLEWFLSDAALMDLVKDSDISVNFPTQITQLNGYRVNRSRGGRLNELVRLDGVNYVDKFFVSTLTLLNSRSQEKPYPGYLIDFVDLHSRLFVRNPKIDASPQRILR